MDRIEIHYKVLRVYYTPFILDIDEDIIHHSLECEESVFQQIAFLGI